MSPGSPSDDPIHALFHTLWSKAVEAPFYDKREWCRMQQMLWALQGLTPAPPDLDPEPLPFDIFLTILDREARENGSGHPPED